MSDYGTGKIRFQEAGLPPKVVSVLAALGPPTAFAKDACVYRQGEAADDLFCLLYGRVKVTLVGASGQEAILRIHVPQGIMGLTALASRPVRDATAVCIDPVSAVRIPRPEFVAAMRDDPDVALHVIRLLTDRMSDFHHRVGDWLGQSVEQRLSLALLALSAHDAGTGDGYALKIPLTHEELAQLINSRRPTVSSVISRLVDLGLVRQSRRKLVVVDRDLLERHAHGDALPAPPGDATAT